MKFRRFKRSKKWPRCTWRIDSLQLFGRWIYLQTPSSCSTADPSVQQSKQEEVTRDEKTRFNKKDRRPTGPAGNTIAGPRKGFSRTRSRCRCSLCSSGSGSGRPHLSYCRFPQNQHVCALLELLRRSRVELRGAEDARIYMVSLSISCFSTRSHSCCPLLPNFFAGPSHSHSKYAISNGEWPCRFHFPPPSLSLPDAITSATPCPGVTGGGWWTSPLGFPPS